jgi:hypothetical protein
MKLREGKLPFSIQAYELLASKFMKMDHEQRSVSAVFCWGFLVLQWNLMSRSDSVETLMLPHIDWNGDCMTIEEQGQKADQTGEDKFPKHVYANPLQPVICPILAIAVLVFSCSSADSFANRQLFCGTDSKGRFGKHLGSTMARCNDAERLLLGAFIEDLGTHSLRKGWSQGCHLIVKHLRSYRLISHLK